tara:strand:+ start:2484 stop:3863 length:1380 start_codon:yes stop_codon:yes gene_type:complete
MIDGLSRLVSVPAEQAILGAVFLDANALLAAQEKRLTRECFSQPGHRKLWAAIEQQAEAGRPIDPITMAELLARRGDLDAVGGEGYLIEIATGLATASNAAHYAEIIVRYAQNRLWLGVIEEAREQFYSERVQDPIAEAERILAKLHSRNGPDGLVSLEEVLKDYVINVLDERFKRDGVLGLETGFKHLDFHLNGLQSGRLYVIAGRPGMGKTALALNMIRSAAVALNADPAPASMLVFSLEMDRVELIDRFVAAQAKIKQGLLFSGKVFTVAESMTRLGPAIDQLRKSCIKLCDASSMTATEIVSMARQMHRREPVKMIVVDYLGLVDVDGSSDRHDLKLAAVTGSLKRLAREMGCPVLLLSQLSRKVEDRKDRRPMLSDLKDSGAIEADADVVMFCYRDEYYHEDTDYPNQMDVIIAKNRGGPLVTDYLRWQGDYQLLENRPDASGQDGAATSDYNY